MIHPKRLKLKNFFLLSFPNDDFIAETIEESAEEQLAGFRSGIAMINMIGYVWDDGLRICYSNYSDDVSKW